MENITKIKLINSLIDAVTHFYDLKQKDQKHQLKHLKGFCEGIAYTLVQIEAIDEEEAKRILQGLGKHREEIQNEDKPVSQELILKEEIDKKKESDPNDLEIPTVFRKKELTPDSSLI